MNESERGFGCRVPGTEAVRGRCSQEAAVLLLSGGKRKDVAACVDLWPAVIAQAGWMQS